MTSPENELSVAERIKETALERLRRDVLALENPFRTFANVLGLIERAVQYEKDTHDRMRGLRITMMRNEIKEWEREHPRPVTVEESAPLSEWDPRKPQTMSG